MNDDLHDETGRYIRTAKVRTDRVLPDGPKNLVIRCNTSQSFVIDLTDNELRNVRDAINEYLSES